MDKLGLRTTAELTRYALEHGITRGGVEKLRFSLDPDFEAPESIPNAVELQAQSR
jgi:hypothetical protein